MNSVFDKNLLPEFESIKDDDEVILWTGRPRFIPYILSGLPLAMFFMVFGAVWIYVNYYIFRNNDYESTDPVFDHFWIWGFIPLLIGFGATLTRIFAFSNTAYGYSNKRVMLRTSFIGTDFKAIDFDKIQDIQVNVNAIERMYNVGSVRFYSGSLLFKAWISIENPYEVFKQAKQTLMDIKTDINYPNKLRPDTNKGYKTKYDPKG